MRNVAYLVSVLLAAHSAGAFGEDVSISKLPKPVTDAIKARFADGTLREAKKVRGDSGNEFEVTLKQGGKQLVVTLSPDGTIRSIERETASKDLPHAVAEAVSKKAPKAIQHAAWAGYVLENGKETLDYYWIELVTSAKRAVQLEIAPDGTLRQVVRELAVKDLPRTVSEAIRKRDARAEIKSVEVYYDVVDGKEVADYYWVELLIDKKPVELEVLPDGTIDWDSSKK